MNAIPPVAPVAMGPAGHSPFNKKMDLEESAVVGRNHPPNRLHPVAAVKKCGDVTHPELSSPGSALGRRGNPAPLGPGLHPGPKPARLEDLLIVGSGIPRDEK